jgi:hypothetical protein
LFKRSVKRSLSVAIVTLGLLAAVGGAVAVADTLIGTVAGDHLVGTPAPDQIYGEDGDD